MLQQPRRSYNVDEQIQRMADAARRDIANAAWPPVMASAIAPAPPQPAPQSAPELDAVAFVQAAAHNPTPALDSHDDDGMAAILGAMRSPVSHGAAGVDVNWE